MNDREGDQSDNNQSDEDEKEEEEDDHSNLSIDFDQLFNGAVVARQSEDSVA